MSRIAETFERLKTQQEAALMPYLMVGYPSMEKTKDLLRAVVAAGADLVELGIPFSDPMADGATLQRVNQLALDRGANLRRALELVHSMREEIRVPLVLMSYYNPVLRLGDEEFTALAGEAGVDGLIVPDLPVEEAAPLRRACHGKAIDLIGMVAPTSSSERIAAVAGATSGFLYCVALKGVTGARGQLQDDAERLVVQARKVSKLPAAVGFGLSTAEQVRKVASYADGVVVASALLDAIDSEPGREVEAAARFVSRMKAACIGARVPSPIPQLV